MLYPPGCAQACRPDGNMTSGNNSQVGRPIGSMHEGVAACSYPILGSENEKLADIRRRMKRHYGDACVSLQQVYEWHRKFKSVVSTLADAEN
jgi:hypothetical protein